MTIQNKIRSKATTAVAKKPFRKPLVASEGSLALTLSCGDGSVPGAAPCTPGRGGEAVSSLSPPANGGGCAARRLNPSRWRPTLSWAAVRRQAAALVPRCRGRIASLPTWRCHWTEKPVHLPRHMSNDHN